MALICATGGLLAPQLAGAQSIDIGPAIGLYVPFGALVQSGSLKDSNYFQQRLQVTPIASASITVWTSARVGFEATIGYSPSAVAVTDSSGISDHHSSVLLTSARVLFAFTPMYFKAPKGKREIPWSFYVGIGPAIVNRSGDVWQYSKGFMKPGLLLTFGVRTPLGGRVILRMDLDDYMSQSQFDKGLATETAARFHNDIVVNCWFVYRVRR